MKGLIINFIVRNWLRYFTLFFAILLLVITIAEYVTGLLDNQSIGVITQGFAYKLPGFITKIIPVNALLASAFSLSAQKATNELTAILAGGFSKWRYVLVVLGVASFFTAIQFLILGFVEPAVFKHKYSQEISLKTLRKDRERWSDRYCQTQLLEKVT